MVSFPPSNDLHKPPTTGKVVMAVHIEAKSQSAADEVVSHVKRIQAFTKQSEPNTLTYRVHKSADDGKTVFIYEEYENAAAMHKHTEGSEFKSLIARAEELTDQIHCRWYHEQ